MPPLTNISIPTYSQILTSMLSNMQTLTAYYQYNNGQGLSISPGSELYLRFATIAGQRAVQYQMMNVLVNSKLISTATGADLDAVAANFGLKRRGAQSSQGFVQLVSTVPITLSVGSILTGSNSLQFQVARFGVYSPGSNVQIASVDRGSQTNLSVGSILTWQNSQANMQSTCQVSVAVTGGIDAEDDATLRNRLYLSLQSPAAMGNGQNLTTLSGAVDGLVQQAFVYSNFNGAGTQLITLAGYQTSSYIGRDIPHLLSDGYVKPYGVLGLSPGLLPQTAAQSGLSSAGYGAYNYYSAAYGNTDAGNYGSNLSADTSAIYGQLPGGVANPYATVITTVNNVPSNLAAVLTLPYPVGSAQNGFGNGWVDAAPFPNPDGFYVTTAPAVVSVQGVNSTISSGGQTTPPAAGFGITITAPSTGLIHTNPPFVSKQVYNNNSPTAGASHINWVNRSDAQENGWSVVQATIIDFKDLGNDTWQLILDTPLTFGSDGYDFYSNTEVAIGDYIFPASVNAQSYINQIMIEYALLGPGQATASQGLLALGAARFPSSNANFPTTIGVQLEKALVENFNEVYQAVVSPTNGTAVNTAYLAPSVNSPPNIFVPHQIGLFPIEFWGFGNSGKI